MTPPGYVLHREDCPALFTEEREFGGGFIAATGRCTCDGAATLARLVEAAHECAVKGTHRERLNLAAALQPFRKR